jgi:hypothetical protein
LWHYLSCHEDIEVPHSDNNMQQLWDNNDVKSIMSNKELNWFNRPNWQANIADYERNWISSRVKGEITSSYYTLADRILSVYPDVKIILTWREPVSRFVSHISLLYYFAFVAKVKLPGTFDRNLTAEQFTKIIDSHLSQLTVDELNTFDIHKNVNQYESIVGFILQFGERKYLEQWKNTAKNLLIINSEDLYTNQIDTLIRLSDFLEIKRPVENITSYHDNAITTKLKLSSESIKKLEDYYNKY